jgi:hypothetical protein
VASDQVRIAELVPEIAEFSRLGIGAFEVALTAARSFDNAAEHHQMRGVRFMKPGDDSIDNSQRALWRDHETRPTLSGGRRSALVGDCFQRTNDGRADGDDAVTVASGGVDTLGCLT